MKNEGVGQTGVRKRLEVWGARFLERQNRKIHKKKPGGGKTGKDTSTKIILFPSGGIKTVKTSAGGKIIGARATNQGNGIKRHWA